MHNPSTDKAKMLLPLQKPKKISQEELDTIVVEILADAIRNMQKLPSKKKLAS